MKTIDEVDLMFLRRANQPKDLAPLRGRIGPAPEFSMVGVVLRRVEISIHAARRAEFKQSAPMRHRPRRTEKTFDNAASAKSLGGVHTGANFAQRRRWNKIAVNEQPRPKPRSSEFFEWKSTAVPVITAHAGIQRSSIRERRMNLDVGACRKREPLCLRLRP